MSLARPPQRRVWFWLAACFCLFANMIVWAQTETGTSAVSTFLAQEASSAVLYSETAPALSSPVVSSPASVPEAAIAVTIPSEKPVATDVPLSASGTPTQGAPASGAATVTASGTASGTAGVTAEREPGKGEGDGEPKTGYLNHDRLNVLIIILVLLGLVTVCTYQSQSGKEMFIRRISGLAAIDDAVGRATEMGRPVLFVPGIMDMDDIQTIAGVTILGHVAKKTAEYDTPLLAPMTRAFVMSVAQEVVYQSYVEKGCKEAFRADRINYLTDDQFGYVAGVGGIMMREKPAACFYLGTFYAESLILAETGHSVGAIQIAGTAEPSQIPFFVAACDYTLIGEELFAASAYLSRNPKEVGALKGQDMSKLIIIAMILLGVLLVTVSQNQPDPDTSMKKLSSYYMDLLKTE